MSMPLRLLLVLAVLLTSTLPIFGQVCPLGTGYSYPSSTGIGGWACKVNQNQPWLHIFIDGSTNANGNKYLGAVQCSGVYPGTTWSNAPTNTAFFMPVHDWLRLPSPGSHTFQAWVSNNANWLGTGSANMLTDGTGAISIPGIQGFVDSVNHVGVAGWAAYPALPNVPLYVHIYKVVGSTETLLATVVANDYRSDLTGLFGGNTGNLGFHWNWPSPLPLSSTTKVKCYASYSSAPQPANDQQIGSMLTYSVPGPGGFLESSTPGTLDGWACISTTSSGWVHFFYDGGTTLGSGKYLGAVLANGTRTDVAPIYGGNANVGFNFPCNQWKRLPPPGNRSIQAYLSSSSTWTGTAGTTLLSNSVGAGTVNVPAIQGFVDSTDFSGVQGWACYPGAPNQALWIHVTDSGAGSSSHLANLPSVTSSPCSGGTLHGFTYNWPSLPPLGSTRTVTLQASFSPTPLLTDTQIGTPTVWTANPIGNFDGADVGAFQGWATLSGAGIPLWAHLYEDTGAPTLIHLASTPVGTVGRTDVQSLYGLPSANVGFAAMMPRYYPGTSTIISGPKSVRLVVSTASNHAAVGGIELPGGPKVVHFGEITWPGIGGSPRGVIEFMDEFGISGWAIDPDGNDPVILEFYAQQNGVGPIVLLGTSTANLPRVVPMVGQVVPPPGEPEISGFGLSWVNPPPAGPYNIIVVAKDPAGTHPDNVLLDFHTVPNGTFNFGEMITFPSFPSTTADPTTFDLRIQNAVSTPSGSETRGIARLDIDGDGIYEEAFGNPSQKQVVITSLNGTVLHTVNTSADAVSFGWSLASVDVDGDGDDELLVGDPKWSNGRGRAQLFDFVSGSYSQIQAVTAGVTTTVNAWFGFTVEGLGDLDGDGNDDWCVGAPRSLAGTGLGGFARVYSGNSSSYIANLYPQLAADRFGWCVATLGDVDGDGQPEFGVGAPSFLESGTIAGEVIGQGAVYVYGWDGASIVLEATILPPNTAAAGFGFSFDGISDVDSDGYGDIAVGAPFGSVFGQSGQVIILAGGAIPGQATIGNTIFGGKGAFGTSVVFAGDLNGDGIGDFVAGSMGVDRVRGLDLFPIYSSMIGPPVQGPPITLEDFLGFSIAPPSDLNSGQVLVGGWNSSFHIAKFGRDTSQPGQADPLPNGSGYRINFALSTILPPAPTGLVVSNDLHDRVTVSWSPVFAAGGYKIYRNDVLFATIPGASNTSVDDFPPPGGFKYSLRAFNALGDGPLSASVSAQRLSENLTPIASHRHDSLFGLVSDDQGRLYVGHDRDDGVLVPLHAVSPELDYLGTVISSMATLGPAVQDADSMCSDGNNIYVSDQNSGLWKVPTDGSPASVLIPLMVTADRQNPLVCMPSTGHIYSGRYASLGLREWDAQGNFIGIHPSTDFMTRMDLDEVAGIIYYCNHEFVDGNGTTAIYTFDLNTLTDSFLAHVPGGVTWLEWDREGRRLFVARKDAGPQTAEVLSLHPLSGQIAVQLEAGELDEILGLEVDHKRGALYVLDRESLDQKHHIYWMKLLPGTDDDLAMGISVNGGYPHADVANEVLTVYAGDVIDTTVLSPNGGLMNEYFFVLGQYMNQGALPQSPPTLLRSYVNEYGYILLDAGQFAVMPYMSQTIVQPFLAGRDYVFQIFCPSGLAQNGIVALSEGRIMHFR